MNAKQVFSALLISVAGAYAQDVTWLPANSSGALALDYRALRANPMFARFIDKNERAAESAGVSALPVGMMDLTSVFKKDVAKVLVAMLPGAKPSEMHGVFFMSGTFDADQIATRLKADPNCKVAVREENTVYAPKSSGGRYYYVVFPAKNLIVGSDNLDALLSGLKTRQKKAPSLSSNSRVARAISNAAANGIPLVFASETSAQAGKGKRIPLIGGNPPNFLTFLLREKDSEHLYAKLTGLFCSDAEASQVASALNTIRSLAALKGAINIEAMPAIAGAVKPELNPLADILSNPSISMAAKGKEATASATIDEAMLNALFGLIATPSAPASSR